MISIFCSVWAVLQFFYVYFTTFIMYCRVFLSIVPPTIYTSFNRNRSSSYVWESWGLYQCSCKCAINYRISTSVCYRVYCVFCNMFIKVQLYKVGWPKNNTLIVVSIKEWTSFHVHNVQTNIKDLVTNNKQLTKTNTQLTTWCSSITNVGLTFA